MHIEIISCLQDNYSYLIIDDSNNSACVVDPSESKPIINFLENKNIKIFKSLALNNLNSSTINEGNLGVKNLFADLGIFLIEK